MKITFEKRVPNPVPGTGITHAVLEEIVRSDMRRLAELAATRTTVLSCGYSLLEYGIRADYDDIKDVAPGSCRGITVDVKVIWHAANQENSTVEVVGVR